MPKLVILNTNFSNEHIQIAEAINEQIQLESHPNAVIRDVSQDTKIHIHEYKKELYVKCYTTGGRQYYQHFHYQQQ
jgi:hypothetical protein